MSNRSLRGFTVIEMLATIAIIGLASAIIVPQLQRFHTKTELKTFRNQLKADIRQTRTWSQAVKNGTPITGATYNDALVAYAVHFDITNSTYTIWEVWQDALGNQATFALETHAARKITKPLPKGITFASLDPNDSDIYYSVPTGDINGSLDTLSFTNGKIILTLQMKSLQDTITIWDHGDLT